ncbi:uncharacterized protein LOC141489180 [Macrotis lagotis]|uniref:uncharacterized protein LOC141489180 n=1 Tax=Macrotis lagotis TaxID=92651 RepID=UPI003D6839CE
MVQPARAAPGRAGPGGGCGRTGRAAAHIGAASSPSASAPASAASWPLRAPAAGRRGPGHMNGAGARAAPERAQRRGRGRGGPGAGPWRHRRQIAPAPLRSAWSPDCGTPASPGDSSPALPALPSPSRRRDLGSVAQVLSSSSGAPHPTPPPRGRLQSSLLFLAHCGTRGPAPEAAFSPILWVRGPGPGGGGWGGSSKQKVLSLLRIVPGSSALPLLFPRSVGGSQGPSPNYQPRTTRPSRRMRAPQTPA